MEVKHTLEKSSFEPTRVSNIGDKARSSPERRAPFKHALVCNIGSKARSTPYRKEPLSKVKCPILKVRLGAHLREEHL